MGEEAKKSRRYHTPACGRATTNRCRCICGGARHGKLLARQDEEDWEKFLGQEMAHGEREGMRHDEP